MAVYMLKTAQDLEAVGASSSEEVVWLSDEELGEMPARWL